MNKIIYIANSPQAYQGSGGRTRIISVAHLHQKMGYETRIFCLVPLSKYTKLGYLKKARVALANEANCPVTYIPTLPTFSIKWLIGLRNLLSILMVRLVAMLHKPNIVHSHGLGAAYLSTKAAKGFSNIFLTADIHGASPEEAAYSKNLALDSPYIQELNKHEAEVYKHSDLCVFVSNRMLDHVQQKYGFVPKNRVVIPCATTKPEKLGVANKIREELNIGDRLAFVYLGSYRKYQMAEETVALFKQIKDRVDNCVLVIFTSHIKEFKKAAQEAQLTEEDYRIKTLSRDEVPSYLASMDIGFMLRQDELLNKVASPTKFAEYLISGIPVITTPYVGDYSAFVMDHQLGFVSDDLAFSTSLQDFVTDVQQNRDAYRDRCQSLSTAHLTWQAVEENYKSVLPS